ncbi:MULTISPECIES: hypothetical protein [unclassified Mesorhizobium]|uniref:hypothetical protein n=1 Tax=unclassified Mesorhizobium TaxID=325217 RepID=UPI001129C065|nr:MULTISPECIES: hypothetical protein [unclassified Mesorhizobium]TPK54233.1 hypothetical protein FJ550_11755 [Mesorhizobium sp. B2-5-2]TPL25400.1 hypothetical protein FJ946_15275 [Mesorhizobium sp. B2-4-7]TPL29346.1 hypothetical protein FJ945_06840 [Mesorhizobium sp. B2-4-9]TPL41165.1 hypothetical protein FJ961_15460 [Mesorhizobium sp. B2-4-5]TPM75054.1 hypothetical protein FJ968_13265 [Mesorhizobium sp. B2-1-6]
MQSTLSITDDPGAVESSATAISWGPIIAGAFAASTLTFILMLLGSGLGLSMVSPWSGSSASITSFAVSTAVWLIVVQWLSSGLGGYLAGRLRTKWVGVHTDEVYFRDTAHGFLAWALATLLVVGVLGSALSAAVGSGVQAVSSVAAGAAQGASAGASANAGGASTDNATSYLVDSLFRPADAARLAAANPQNDAAAAAQASRILVASAAAGEVSPEDKTYLSQLVAARTGLSEADAKTRVDTLLAKAQDAKAKAQQAADTARKASATFALLGALSLVIGAFIASAAAALGGRQRDGEEAVFLTSR